MRSNQVRITILFIFVILLNPIFVNGNEYKLYEREKASKKFAFILANKLTSDVLIPYLIKVVPKNYSNSTYKYTFIGIYGVHQYESRATVYFLVGNMNKNNPSKKGVANKSFDLVRLDNGAWFNIDRNRFVGIDQ